MKKNYDQVICELTARNHQLTIALKEATLAVKEAEAELRSLSKVFDSLVAKGLVLPAGPMVTRWISGT